MAERSFSPKAFKVVLRRLPRLHKPRVIETQVSSLGASITAIRSRTVHGQINVGHPATCTFYCLPQGLDMLG